MPSKQKNKIIAASEPLGNDVPKKPLVFTTTTTTTTTKHFTFDKNSVDFEQIKRLLGNDNANDVPVPAANDGGSSSRASFVRPSVTAAVRKRPLVDIQNRHSRSVLPNNRRPSQWTVSDVNLSSVDFSSVAPIKVKIEPGTEETVASNATESTMPQASNYTGRVSSFGTNASRMTNGFGKLSMSRVSNVHVSPWGKARGRTVLDRLKVSTMKSTGAIPKLSRSINKLTPIASSDIFNANLSRISVLPSQNPRRAAQLQSPKVRASCNPLLQSTQIDLMPPPMLPLHRGRRPLQPAEESPTLHAMSEVLKESLYLAANPTRRSFSAGAASAQAKPPTPVNKSITPNRQSARKKQQEAAAMALPDFSLRVKSVAADLTVLKEVSTEVDKLPLYTDNDYGEIGIADQRTPASNEQPTEISVESTRSTRGKRDKKKSPSVKSTGGKKSKQKDSEAKTYTKSTMSTRATGKKASDKVETPLDTVKSSEGENNLKLDTGAEIPAQRSSRAKRNKASDNVEKSSESIKSSSGNKGKKTDTVEIEAETEASAKPSRPVRSTRAKRNQQQSPSDSSDSSTVKKDSKKPKKTKSTRSTRAKKNAVPETKVSAPPKAVSETKTGSKQHNAAQDSKGDTPVQSTKTTRSTRAKRNVTPEQLKTPAESIVPVMAAVISPDSDYVSLQTNTSDSSGIDVPSARTTRAKRNAKNAELTTATVTSVETIPPPMVEIEEATVTEPEPPKTRRKRTAERVVEAPAPKKPAKARRPASKSKTKAKNDTPPATPVDIPDMDDIPILPDISMYGEPSVLPPPIAESTCNVRRFELNDKKKPTKQKTLKDKPNNPLAALTKMKPTREFSPIVNKHLARVKNGMPNPIKIYSPSQEHKHKKVDGNKVLITNKEVQAACGKQATAKNGNIKIEAQSRLIYLPRIDTPKMPAHMKPTTSFKTVDFLRPQRRSIFMCKLE